MSKPLTRRISDLAPDPEMWAALDGGDRLTRILSHFYTQVFADARLAPFFKGTTQQWVAEKQYSFLRQTFTGEKVYFGDRPRNAHHWMVISDELFDYRESLMEASLRAHDLPEHLIQRWRAMENLFRKQIVKQAPVPRKLRGEALPLEGYEALMLTVGTLCDGCGLAVDTGTSVRYHVRTGQTYCPSCMPAQAEHPIGAQAPEGNLSAPSTEPPVSEGYVS